MKQLDTSIRRKEELRKTGVPGENEVEIVVFSQIISDISGLQ